MYIDFGKFRNKSVSITITHHYNRISERINIKYNVCWSVLLIFAVYDLVCDLQLCASDECL